VQQVAVNRFVRWMVASGAFAGATAAASAGTLVGGEPTTPRDRQLTLYVSQSLGSGSTSRLRFGLRIEGIGGTPIVPPMQTQVGLQYKELVDLQLAPGSDAGVTLGKRLTWNFRGARLGLRSSSPAPSALAIDAFRLPDRSQLSRWDARASDPSRTGMALDRQSRVGSTETRSNVPPPILGFGIRGATPTTFEFPPALDRWCCAAGWRPDGAGKVAIAAHSEGFYRALKDVDVGDQLDIASLAGTRPPRVRGFDRQSK
jgi:hypothetical protein